MPITYNIEEDAFYKEGLKRGMQRLEREKALRQREKELRKMEKELRQQEKEQAIAQMLTDQISPEKIATYLNVSLQQVSEVAEKIKN